MDNIKRREAELVISETDNTTTNIKVGIALDASLPIVVMDMAKYANNVIKTETIPATGSINVKLTLVDNAYEAEHGVKRFIYVTTTKHATNGNILRVYYDEKYKDLFIIGDLGNLDEHKAQLKNHVIELRGYGIGYNPSINVSHRIANTSAAVSTDIHKYQRTNTDLGNTLYTMVLDNALPATQLYNTTSKEITTGVRYSSRTTLPATVISLGSFSTLFATDEAIPYNILATSHVNDQTVKNIGYGKPGNSLELVIFIAI